MKKALWQRQLDILSECVTGNKKAKLSKAKAQQQAIVALYNRVEEIHNTLEKKAADRDSAKENAPQLLFNLSTACRYFDTAERIQEKHYRVHPVAFDRDVLAPQLLVDIADTTDKIIAAHGDDAVDWSDYEDICKMSPQATNLWRKHSDKFDYEDYYAIRSIVDLMPEEFCKKVAFSNDGKMYSGPFMPHINTIPVAHYYNNPCDPNADPIYVLIGEYANNSDMILDDIESENVTQKNEIANFIDDARIAFMPLFVQDANTHMPDAPTVK